MDNLEEANKAIEQLTAKNTELAGRLTDSATTINELRDANTKSGADLIVAQQDVVVAKQASSPLQIQIDSFKDIIAVRDATILSYEERAKGFTSSEAALTKAQEENKGLLEQVTGLEGEVRTSLVATLTKTHGLAETALEGKDLAGLRLVASTLGGRAPQGPGTGLNEPAGGATPQPLDAIQAANSELDGIMSDKAKDRV